MTPASATWLLSTTATDQTVEAPSLDGLVVTLPAPIAVSESEVFSRLAAWAFEFGTTRQRAVGERIEAADLVNLEVLCLCAGRVVPLSAYGPLWLPVASAFSVGVAADWLLEVCVGQGFQRELTLAASFWEPRVAGLSANLVGRVSAAKALTIEAFDTDAFWQRTGRFASLAEAVNAAVKAIDLERAGAAWVTTLHEAYSQLLQRVSPTVDPAAVDREVDARWQQGDGAVLRRLAVAADAVEDSRQAWLTSAPLRAAAERSLAISSLNEAIAAKEKLTLDARKVESMAGAFGLTAEAVAEVMQRAGHEVLPIMYALMVAEHLVSQVQVTVAS